METTTANRDFTRRAMLQGSVALAAGAMLPGLARARDGVTYSSWPAVEAMMRSYVESGKLANMVAGLGYGSQDADYLRFGNTSLTSGVAADPDTLYRIYSMTKPITGLCAMLLIEDGRLQLDQPLSEILPAFANMQVQKVYDGPITPDNLEPAVRPITIRHLLTHTSGLGYSIVQQGPLSEAFREAGLVPGLVTRLQALPVFRGWPVDSLAKFADGLAAMPLVYQPGTRWSYSTGLDLMGRVIEVVSGLSFDAFMKERILDPCGMRSTFFQVPKAEASRLATSYYLLNDILLPIDLPQDSVFTEVPPFPFGGSGLVSSARDYDRFLKMLALGGQIDGRRIAAEQTVALATSNLLPDTLAPGGGFSFGGREFGFGAAGLVGKGDAAGLFGWFGAAGTAGLVNMALGLRHNLMTQYMPSGAYPISEQFALAVAADAQSQLSRGV